MLLVSPLCGFLQVIHAAENGIQILITILFFHVPNSLIVIIHHSLLGIAAMGTYTVCFVWAMESVSGRYKTFISTFMNFGWPIGR